MDNTALLATFSVLVMSGACWLAKRDVLFAGFYLFFFIYVIFALIGYAYFPAVSLALGLYVGPEVLRPAVAFLLLSFGGFLGTYALFGERLIHRGWIGVDYRPAPVARMVFFTVIVLFVVLMASIFARDYDQIAYGNDPQMPSFIFSIGFKQMPVVTLVLYAFVRRHSRTALELAVGCGLLIAEAVLFGSIASKSGNRTDVLALSLGVLMYELYPLITDPLGGIRLQGIVALARRPGVVGAIASIVAAGTWLMLRNYSTRGSSQAVEGLPVYASLLYNDFFPPAHMLFGAISLHWIEPLTVIKSNLANATFTGRLLDVPYLQQDLGNVLVPGSSTRSGSFAYYIFAEGYMFAGPFGFLYNAIVPAIGLLGWRRLSATSDPRANLFWAAFAAMFFADVARSQSALIPRYLLFNGVPAAILFSIATGAVLTRAPRT